MIHNSAYLADVNDFHRNSQCQPYFTYGLGFLEWSLVLDWIPSTGGRQTGLQMVIQCKDIVSNCKYIHEKTCKDVVIKVKGDRQWCNWLKEWMKGYGSPVHTQFLFKCFNSNL